MTECEDCGEDSKRRKRCWHCDLMVCGWCWHHIHRCEPSHSKAECRDLLETKTEERMLKVTVVAPNGAEVTEDFKTENTVAFVYLQATDKLIAQGHIRRDDNVFFVNPKSDRALAAGLNVSDIADGEDAIKLRLRNERIPTGG